MLGLYEMFFVIFLVFGILLPLWALIDILKSNFEGNNKLIWIIVVVFTNLLGVLLYILMGRKQKIPK